jgi:hypothetical protein
MASKAKIGTGFSLRFLIHLLMRAMKGFLLLGVLRQLCTIVYIMDK